MISDEISSLQREIQSKRNLALKIYSTKESKDIQIPQR